ncbi:glutamate-1-semialdehyde 2,1-aminomutase [Hoeflea sp. BAL378]|uniref:aspartate aminotransferase family protein n=1 Tax=Hoeflea sp. BAL378 TaxID=1547437 RepID=UPI000512AC7A|nr:glutamate-1-semialdehyde 2,1-aminomutase [Hoeflea sp. BAL378]KGF68925.1 glutamate-1-semialdehyde 2,1-aminomutase [Hoeflea sp. BAL378]
MPVAAYSSNRYEKSRQLFERSCEVIPGGVNSTARATWSGWLPHPLFVERGEGARVWDADGNEYIDYLIGLGPMLLGHRPEKVTEAVVRAIREVGTVFAMPSQPETVLAHKLIAAVPSLEQVRLCNTGTEAVLYSVRLARAFTGRKKVIRFEGMYHGFSDGVYWSKHPDPDTSGPDDAPRAIPQGPGMPEGIAEGLIILPWNDIDVLRAVIEREGHDIAAVLTEPVMCNTGCILPHPGYLEAMRELTAKHGILLIFDEVITGFRLALGGAQARLGVTPDLSTFAKGIGGGFPVAAMGGRKDIMSLVADGRVSIAGTYAGNTIAVASANATLDILSQPGFYDSLDAVSDRLRLGLIEVFNSAGISTRVVGMGAVYQVWFTEHDIHNYRDAARCANHDLFRIWWEGMLDRGILFHPGAFENLFITFAHTNDDVDRTLEAAREVAKLIRAA